MISVNNSYLQMMRSLTRSKSDSKLNPIYQVDSYGRNYEMLKTTDGIVLNKSGIDLDLYQLGKKGMITPQVLTNKIESVVTNLGEGNHSLYPRTWNQINEDYWFNHLTIVQYTPLPESFYITSETQTPFISLLPYDSIIKLLPDNKITTYPGSNWEIRKWRILEEMLRILVDSSGIMGVEEMDNFYNFFYPALKILGYEGVFVPKTKSLGVVAGWYSEGCALFWNYSDFKLHSLNTGNYLGTNDIYLMALLENRRNHNKILTVVTTLNKQNSNIQVNKLLDMIQNYQCPIIIIIDSNSSQTINNLVSHNFQRIYGSNNNSILYRHLNLISNLSTPPINLETLPNSQYPSSKFCLASKFSY